MEPQNDELIQNFCAITENWNVEVAVAYLSHNNWDLTAAYNEYLGLAPSSPAREIPAEAAVPVPVPVENRPLSIKDWIFAGISWLASPVTSRIRNIFSKPQESGFSAYLQALNLQATPKSTAMSLENAANFAQDRSKLLLIYLHHDDTPERFVRNVLCSRDVVSIIDECFIFYGQMLRSEEGITVVESFSDDDSLHFLVLNPLTTEILARMDSLPTKEALIEFLIRFIPQASQNQDIRLINDRIIREQQEKEFRDAERMVMKKAEEDRRKQEMRIKEQEEEEYLRKQEEIAKANKMKMLGDEPEAGPDVSQITFRLPNGEKIERRFSKNTQIEVLYLFLETKGVKNAEVVSGFPAKVLRSGSLESEGLIGRVLIHVRLIQ